MPLPVFRPSAGPSAVLLIAALLTAGCRGWTGDATAELQTLGAQVEKSAEGAYRVDVRGNPSFTDEKLDLVARLPGVTDLTLENVPVTDAGLERLRPLAGLRRLILNESDVTGRGLSTLAGLPLRRGLCNLGLRGLKLTDADLPALKGLPILARLDLSGTAVTDAGLSSLTGMKLQVVNLKGTKVTERGVATLKQAIPGLQVMR